MAAKKMGTEYWSSVNAVDNYTVRINLTKFQNSIVTALVSTTGGMISPTAFERNGIEWAKFHPVGTGPFKFKSFERNVSVTWERFDDYWGGKPYLDGIKFVVIVDPMTQAAAFQAGEGDIIQSKTPSVSAQLNASGKYDMIWGVSGMSSWSPDSANPDSPYTNKKVREAVQYALDQKTMVDKLGQGMWKYTNQVAPQESIGYVDSLAGRPYNPAKAKQLLAEAGYPSGFKTSLISNNSEVPRELLEAMQKYFADVGLTADIQYLPQAAWNELVFKGWHNGYIYEGVGMSPNYAYALNNFFGVTSPFLSSLRRSQGWGEALDKALTATDYEGMKRYTQEAVKIAHDDAMMIFTDAHGTPYFQHKYVQNSGFYAVGHFMAWTPEKCWLDK
jgi:ABC-type transport system substrate-binding protein